MSPTPSLSRGVCLCLMFAPMCVMSEEVERPPQVHERPLRFSMASHAVAVEEVIDKQAAAGSLALTFDGYDWLFRSIPEAPVTQDMRIRILGKMGKAILRQAEARSEDGAVLKGMLERFRKIPFSNELGEISDSVGKLEGKK